MIIAVCQMEVEAKKPRANYERALRMLENAKGAQVALFGEMTIPGYMVGDLWESPTFIEECDYYTNLLIKNAQCAGISIIFGTVSHNANSMLGEDGREQKYNTAVCANSYGCVEEYHKCNLPNYREFDDKRYFTAGSPADLFVEKCNNETVFSTTICEDGWDDDYAFKPIRAAKQLRLTDSWLDKNPDHIHVNLSCSPYTVGKNGARNRRFAKHSTGFTALCYVNCVGIQNNGKGVFTFDGSSTLYKDGEVLGALPPLEECVGFFSVDNGKVTLGKGPWLKEQRDPSMAEVLVYGTRKFLEQNGLKRVVIGLSGGIDSALSAMIHVKALGKENVVLVNMPTQYNSDTTKSLAADIAKNLGCPYLVIPVGDLCSVISGSIAGGIFDYACNGNPSNLSYKEDSENIAARMRGAGIQAALAAGIGGVFPSNGNKSEITVGYCVSPHQKTWSKSLGYSDLRSLEVGHEEMSGNSVLAVLPSVKETRVTIQTSLGTSVECSTDHKVKVQDRTDGSIAFIAANSIDPKKHLVCHRVGARVFGSKVTLPVYEHRKPSWDYRSEPISMPTVLTRDIATFLGICIADGSYGSKNGYTITTTKAFVREFTRGVLASIGVPCSSVTERKSTRYGSLGVRISSSQLVGWLKFVGVKRGAPNKEVPPCILSAPESVVTAFLRGLLLDSSCNETTKELREVVFHSCNLSLIDFVHQALLNLGVLCYKRVAISKNPRHLPKHGVYIPSSETPLLLGIVNPIKQSLQKRASHNEISRRKHKSSLDYVYGHLDARGQLRRFLERKRLWAYSLQGGDGVGRCVAKKWINEAIANGVHSDTRVDPALFQDFKDAVYGIERFFAVTSISTEEGLFPMMDVCLSGNHEFVANSIVVHNCTLGGDHMGYLAPIGDLWKSEVYEVSRELSDSMGGVLPNSIFTLKPSAELSDNQNINQGKGDPFIYWYHDALFSNWMEPWVRGDIYTAAKAFVDGSYDGLLKYLGIHDDEKRVMLQKELPTPGAVLWDMERWWKLFTGMAVVKRVQSPPVLVLKRRSYGFDFRESLGGGELPHKYLDLVKEILP